MIKKRKLYLISENNFLNFFFKFSEDGQSWQCSRREDSKGSSDGGVGEAWEFRSHFYTKNIVQNVTEI